MVDYDRNIGGDVTLKIRDYGQLVEFWILADRYTYNYNQPWSWQVNGVNGSGHFRLEKTGKWQRMGQFTVTSDQNVRFSVQNSGLGFPTYDFVQHINRITVPPAPSAVYFANVLDTSLTAMFNGQGDGGSGILEWQLAYGTNPYTAQYYISSGGTSVVSGLSGGTRYYFWARGRNAVGWGPWSARSDIMTDRIPDPPNPVQFANIAQSSVTAWVDYSGRWDGGSPVLEVQLAYGLDPNAGTLFASGWSVDLASLAIAQKYYFWARMRNALGWGAWSVRSEVLLVAGAYIPVDGVIHRAIPWVKDAGVWKPAKPWSKFNNIWRTTT
jgi:hypothetical protein